MTDALFGVGPVAEPTPTLSADRRRTQRQAAALKHGLHPLSNALGYTIKLHPQAAPADDRQSAGLRCGACRFRGRTSGFGTARWYPKCSFGDQGNGWPRASRGAGTDLRAWWPACIDFEAVDRG